MAAPDLVIVGRLGRTRGLQGEIWVIPDTDFPGRFLGLTEIFVRVRADWEKKKLISARMISNRPVLLFENIASPEDASRLTNCDIAVLKTDVVKLAEGSYYIFDLVGCQVVDEQSMQTVGEIVAVDQYPANDVYIVQKPSGATILCPAVKRFVKHVDIERKQVVVDITGLPEED